MVVRVAVLREVAAGETRVALTPEVIPRMRKSGIEVVVETGAGTAAGYPDAGYVQAGAQIMNDRAATVSGAAVVVKLQPPTVEETDAMASGTIVIAVMNPGRNLDRVARMRDRKLTSFALELLPRITRAQSMDVLSSQATVAGYRATLVGAGLCPKFMPMLTTAAGTIRPAKVLILGAGVAGLMAIATARRLGALVEAYDVRRAAGEQVRSLGAKFLELQINAEGVGGYARELTEDEKRQEAEMVSKAVAEADVVITTANVPGRRAPLLVRKEMVGRMHRRGRHRRSCGRIRGQLRAHPTRKGDRVPGGPHHRSAQPACPAPLPREPDVREEPGGIPEAPRYPRGGARHGLQGRDPGREPPHVPRGGQPRPDAGRARRCEVTA